MTQHVTYTPQIDSCGQYDDDEYDCRANFYISSINVSALSVEHSLNITVYYDREIECDEFVSVTS